MIKIGENDVIWPAHEVETKIPEKFPNNPGIENKGKSRPEKSRDPGIWQNPVPKIPGLKIWIPLGPDGETKQKQTNKQKQTRQKQTNKQTNKSIE